MLPEEEGARIAMFVATSGHSGVDQIVRRLAPEFATLGHRVDVLQVANHGPYWNGEPPGVRFVKLGTAHVNTSLVPLVQYLKKVRPDILLTDKDRVNRLALIARMLAGTPTRAVVRIGTTVSANLARRNALSRWSQYASIRLLYRHAHGIIVPSRGVANDLSSIAGIAEDRIDVIPNPVVDPHFRERADEPVLHPWFQPGQPPVIVGAGELSARKDFATLIRAFAIVRRRRSCRLLILGEGRKRSDLEELVRSLNIDSDVQFPGFDANPVKYMARAAAFALTSTCEGSGIVLVEALAAGTPVVSTDCPSGPRETLADGQFGALVPIGDCAAVASALEDVLQDRPPPELLRQAAEPFTVRASALAYLRAFRLAAGDPVA